MNNDIILRLRAYHVFKDQGAMTTNIVMADPIAGENYLVSFGYNELATPFDITGKNKAFMGYLEEKARRKLMEIWHV